MFLLAKSPYFLAEFGSVRRHVYIYIHMRVVQPFIMLHSSSNQQFLFPSTKIDKSQDRKSTPDSIELLSVETTDIGKANAASW